MSWRAAGEGSRDTDRGPAAPSTWSQSRPCSGGLASRALSEQCRNGGVCGGVVLEPSLEQRCDMEKVVVQAARLERKQRLVVGDAVAQAVESAEAGIDVGTSGSGREGVVQGGAPEGDLVGGGGEVTPEPEGELRDDFAGQCVGSACLSDGAFQDGSGPGVNVGADLAVASTFADTHDWGEDLVAADGPVVRQVQMCRQRAVVGVA